jgi:hypothetical protein
MAALRQSGVLVRGPEHLAAGRVPLPQAVRISLKKPATPALLRIGLARVRQVLMSQPVTGSPSSRSHPARVD